MQYAKKIDDGCCD